MVIHSFSEKSSLGRGRCDLLIFYTLKLTIHIAVDHQVFAKEESQLGMRSEYHDWHPWEL